MSINMLRIAACGVDCGACGQYKVTAEHDINAAESLVGWFRSRGWIGKDEGADAVMKMAPLCKGCRDKTEDVFWKACGPCGKCDLRGCCEDKHISLCGECGVFPCERYLSWIDNLDHHKKAMEYLISLRKQKDG